MLFNKKFYSILLFILCFVVALIGYYSTSKNNIILNNTNEKQITSLQSLKNNTATIESDKNNPTALPIQSSKNSISAHTGDELNTKVEKAFLNIKQKNRKPSTQIVFNPTSTIKNKILNSTEWTIWPHTKVIHVEEKNQNDSIIAEINNLLIVEDNSASADLSHFNINQPVVLFNSRLKKTGILTGTIKILTANKNELLIDLQLAKASISNSFEAIQTYFINSNDEVFDLEKLYEFLKQKTYITKIELEILSRSYEKN